MIESVMHEVERAKLKYPQDDQESRFLAWAQEAGESFQAHAKWYLDQTPEALEHAKEELIQAMAMAYRLYTEVYSK